MGNSLEVQWLRLRPSTAGGTGSIPGQGTKILHTTRHSQKMREREKGREKEMDMAGTKSARTSEEGGGWRGEQVPAVT